VRLVYLGVTNMFALLRLLSVSDQDKDIEILVLRHQLGVLQRQLGTTRPRFSPGDRAFLAAMLHRLPRGHLGRMRIHGELLVLGIKVAASTVWEILRQAGIDPAPDRARTTWASFLRSQADGLLACDFLETVTLDGTRQFVLAVIEHATRQIRILGATQSPDGS
jgi:hypothetical protein